MAHYSETEENPVAHKKALRFLKPSFVVATLLFVATVVAIAIPGKGLVKTSVPFYIAVAIIEVLFLWRYIAGGCKRSTANIVSVVWVLLI